MLAETFFGESPLRGADRSNVASGTPAQPASSTHAAPTARTRPIAGRRAALRLSFFKERLLLKR
jgi:hypothetical protein